MTQKYTFYLSLVFIAGLLSFKIIEQKVFDFAYPKRTGTGITLASERFKKFSKEWRGADYYYATEKDGFICSILYYKLTDDEKKQLVDAPKALIAAPDKSPAYPFAYFSEYSNLKSIEKNGTSWGKPADDFMFRQNDVAMGGFSQKHMYGYAMVDKDIFVNIHLSKVACSAADSTEMMAILSSLSLKK